MRASRNIRIAIDASLAALRLFCLAFRITQDVFHEWLGLCAAALFIMHNAVNIGWYKGILRGAYKPVRIVNTLLNAALLLAAATVFITGILQARHTLSLGEHFGGMQMRQIHTVSAYWLFILAGLHLGTHWNSVCAFLGICNLKSKTARACARILGAGAAVCGIWAFGQRDMYGKLFLGYSFDFWDMQKPALLFFAQNIAIAALCVYMVKFSAYILRAAGRKFFEKAPRGNP